MHEKKNIQISIFKISRDGDSLLCIGRSFQTTAARCEKDLSPAVARILGILKVVLAFEDLKRRDGWYGSNRSEMYFGVDPMKDLKTKLFNLKSILF